MDETDDDMSWNGGEVEGNVGSDREGDEGT